MQHSFDVELAKEYGILEAILIQNIYFWIEKNKANNKHFYDGRYWTYNSRKAFSEMFPYSSYDKIRRALEKLVKNNILLVGNYNQQWSDRTLWYSFSDIGLSIVQKRQMQLSENTNDKWQGCQMTNGKDATPIPYINTYNKPDNKQENIKESSENLSNLEAYKEIVGYMNVVNEHHRFNVKIPFSYKYQSKATQKLINARLREGYNIEEFKDVIWWGYKKFVENEFKTQTGESSYKYFRPSTLFSSEHFEAYLNEYRANTQ